jgi:hypothetical protein
VDRRARHGLADAEFGVLAQPDELAAGSSGEPPCAVG